ncbi:MAG: PQQ-like beta-propeller repeat protein [Phycisphaeraceae bacterium]|nr:PQQ-like beta-propeller repeat protein [Phycisphaeraceae bacterium]
MRHAVICCCLMVLLSSSPGAAELPELSDIPGAEAGLVVMVNPADHHDAARIAGGGRHVVCVLSADAARVRELDQAFIEAKVHPVADAHRWWDPSRLPFRDHSVNVLVVEATRAPNLDEREIRRVIAPGHGVALVLRDGEWRKFRKDRPAEMDIWLGWQRDARGHMGGDDKLVGPVNSYQFLAGPRTARFTPLVTERIALWGGIARDPFSGVILRARNQHASLWRGGDFSDGRRLYLLSRIGRDGIVPVQDLLTGEAVPGGLALGEDFKRNEGINYCGRRWNQVHSDGERIYWTNGRHAVRAACTQTRERLWETTFTQTVEQCASDGDIVVVMLTENNDHPIRGMFDAHTFNVAVAVEGLDAATGQERWRNTDVAGMPSNFLGIGQGTAIASTYLVGPNKRERAQRPVSQQGAGYDQYAANRMVAIDAATGKSRWVRRDFSDIDDYNGRQSIAIQPGMAILVGEYHVNLFDLASGRTLRTITVATDGSTSGHGYEGQYHAVTPRWYFKSTGAAALDGKNPPDLRGHRLHSQRYDTRPTPANGMLYTEPMLGTLHAHNTLSIAAAMINREPSKPLDDNQRLLVRGRAEGVADPLLRDWPTFRGDTRRNAWSSADAPAEPKLVWEARLDVATGPASARTLQQGWRFNPNVPGPLTQPVADGQRVLVAAPDAHRLDCLRLSDGEVLWSAHFGGRISGPPTLAGEVAFVGAGDGTVSAIDLADGKVIWRFFAAPTDELILAHDQVESVYPVPSPTLHDGRLYVTAGRVGALDHGVWIWVLDPRDGRVLQRGTIGAGAPFRVNDILQVHDGQLQLFGMVIDPKTLALSRAGHVRHGNTDTEAPHPIPDGGGIRGGSTWIRPSDQWMGYNNDINAGVVIRSDGLRVDVHTWNDRYLTVREGGRERIINIPHHPFDLVQSVAGAGERLYLAGEKAGKIRLLIVEPATGSHRHVDVDSLRPSSRGIIPDGRAVVHRIEGIRGHEADREYVIPDGIAISHGTIIVTTSAGRVLAFR